MTRNFYVGTYTQSGSDGKVTGSRGIYLGRLDLETGKAELSPCAEESRNPSFLSVSPGGQFLLAANELPEGGALDVYAIGPEGGLTFVSRKPLTGADCCHVGWSPDGAFVTGVHYSSGDVFTCAVDGRGRLGEIVSAFSYEGCGPVKDRQERAHAHSMRLMDALRLAVVCDLGTDKLMLYHYEPSGRLAPAGEVKLPAGCGPRHTEISGNGKILYVACELSSEILVLEYRGGTYSLRQSISMLPEGWAGENTGADLHLSADRKFLYSSNRGHDSICRFRVHEDGTLCRLENTPCGGECPRNFAVAGEFLLCANQTSGNLTMYRILPDGSVGPRTDDRAVPVPVCIAFLSDGTAS